jgi:hypothetical protein
MRLVEHAQFDTVYHEHFSYLSLYTTMAIFSRAGLRVFDVEELPTHGGSLRVYGCHTAEDRPDSPSVAALLAEEKARGMRALPVYRSFQPRADRLKDDLLMFLIEQKRLDRRVAGYGAAAKGNTLLNYAGVKADLLPFISDAAPSKQGKFVPGTHIPIRGPDALRDFRPDTVLVLPWNIADEIVAQWADLRSQGTRFFVAVPELRELP